MSGYDWDFASVWPYLPYIITGLGYTVVATACSMAAGLVAGYVLALLRRSRRRILSVPAAAYTEFFRDTPFLVQLFWAFYVLPTVLQFTLPPLATGIIAMTANLTAYAGEIFRSGLGSIDKGQTEAALALGMNRRQVMRRVLAPQAIRVVIPPLTSTWVSLFKDTSLLATISVTELMYRAQSTATHLYRPLEVYTVIAVVYFVVTYPQARTVDALFKRLRVRG